MKRMKYVNTKFSESQGEMFVNFGAYIFCNSIQLKSWPRFTIAVVVVAVAGLALLCSYI